MCLVTSMSVYHRYSNDSLKRNFAFPFVLEIGIIAGLVFAYYLVIKEIIIDWKEKKKQEIVFKMCGEDKVIQKIGENVMNSSIMQKKKILPDP